MAWFLYDPILKLSTFFYLLLLFIQWTKVTSIKNNNQRGVPFNTIYTWEKLGVFYTLKSKVRKRWCPPALTFICNQVSETELVMMA